MKNDRQFDCVAFKRRAQEKIYEETKGMTIREEIAYYRKKTRTGVLAGLWKANRRNRSAA